MTTVVRETDSPIIVGLSTPAKRQLGEDCIIRLVKVMKAIAQYERANTAVESVAEEALYTINQALAALQHVQIRLVQDACFLNHTRISFSTTNYALTKYFVTMLRERWIGEIEIVQPLTPRAMLALAELLVRLEVGNEGNFLLARQELARRGIDSVRLSKLEAFRDELQYADSATRRTLSKDVYFRTLDLIKDAVGHVQEKRGLHTRKVKRLMMRAVNLLLQDESALLGLANIKGYDDYTFTHSVNVAIYALALGQRIGLSKKALIYLGMAGLFHDLGKTGIEREVLNKPGTLSPEEWQIIRSHPLLGAEMIIGFKDWGELSARMITAAFEHHLRYDQAGYPEVKLPRKLTLFSRIIAIADCYDALGRPRVYRPFPFVPAKILSFYTERSGTDFDPILVKVFLNMIGLYPLGSLVELSTGELGIVVQTYTDAEMIDRPAVCLLQRDEGGYQKGETVQLDELDPHTGAFRRSIIRALDPHAYRIDVGEFFI